MTIWTSQSLLFGWIYWGSLCKGMNKLHIALKNVLFAVTVKQPIVFPLAPLYNAAKFAYACLNHFSFSNLAFGQIYIECASEFDNKSYIHLFSWKLYDMLYSWNVKIVCIVGLLYYHSDFCFVQPFSLSFCRSNRGRSLCLIWLYKIALKLMHYVVSSMHLKALDYFNFFWFFC